VPWKTCNHELAAIEYPWPFRLTLLRTLGTGLDAYVLRSRRSYPFHPVHSCHFFSHTR
jgi:hypothetical protein